MEALVDIAQLRRLSPLDGLKRDNLQALVSKTRVRELAPGQVLFQEGDSEKRTVYVLSGTVELREGDKVMDTVAGGSDRARNPLSPTLPRTVTAVGRDRVQYISIDSDLIDVMLTWDQTGSYEVSELRSDLGPSDDWMTTLLQTKAFHKIPPANIQAIFMRLQQVNFKARDIVIKQGDEGDFFYVITKGRCVVTRETPLNKDGIRLAELEVGDTFGEEALLNEPMLEWVDMEQAEAVVASGGQWLDVRLPSEFEANHRDGAINVPLYFIRLKLKTLDASRRYVVCCDTGRRSSAGAFILNERGFHTVVLKGGLNRAHLE
jgi:rhodanese-related sulfurtransferase